MRPLRFGLLSLFPMLFLIQEMLARPPDNHNEGKKAQEKKEKPMFTPSGCAEDRTSLEFWTGVSIMPVQFVDRNREGTALVAQFSSNLFVQRINFHMMPDQKGSFFMLDDDWEEEISRRVFLKKMKKDYWLVVYLPHENNLICEAHQFKNWEALRATFAQDSINPLNTVDNVAFWQKIKTKPVSFHAVEGNKAHWMFLRHTDELANLGDYIPSIKLENGLYSPKRFKYPDGYEVELLEHGAYQISLQCVFHVVEFKEPRKVASVSLGSPKVRPKLVDRKYFDENAKLKMWLISYDSATKTILRIVEISKPETDEEKETKKDSKKLRDTEK